MVLVETGQETAGIDGGGKRKDSLIKSQIRHRTLALAIEGGSTEFFEVQMTEKMSRKKYNISILSQKDANRHRMESEENINAHFRTK